MKWKVQETQFPAGAWGLESRTRCAGFSVTEIGNRKERLRDYASFPDQCPKRPPVPVPRSRPHGIGRGRTSVSYEKNTYREVIP